MQRVRISTESIDRDNEIVRVNVYGLDKEKHAALEERFDLVAREAFGMTEIGSGLFMPIEAVDMVGSGSCGMPSPFREARVADPEGNTVAVGEIGELLVRGPGILQGYYNKPEATKAAFLAAERMAPRGGGRIVALSSIGTRYCFDYFGLVGSVKAAVEALVGYLAVELAPKNVEVAAVAAGAVDGELLRQFPGRPRWETLAPDGEMTTELQVADAIAFLLTSSGLNGTTIVLDGASGIRTHEPAMAGSFGDLT